MSNLKNLIIFFLISISVSAQNIDQDTFRLYFLGGQSNMDGFGKNSELQDSLRNGYEDVWIFHGNPVGDENPNGGQGKWELLEPGHGSGFSANSESNKLSDKFGVELSFAKKLKQLYPNEKIAIIKYSRGGSSIDSLAAGKFGSWDIDFTGTTGINQYDNFLTTLRNAYGKKDIDGNGKEDLLIPAGIIWMQGESDGEKTEEIAQGYYENLKRLMETMRAALRKDNIPVVIGKISDSWNDKDGKVWDYGELIQFAQEKFARKDKNATIVRSTKFYEYSDPWHYNSKGYIDLGEKFAEAIYKLNTK